MVHIRYINEVTVNGYTQREELKFYNDLSKKNCEHHTGIVLLNTMVQV